MAGSDMFTGTLEVLILKALSWGPRHGYAIGRWIRETTRDSLVVQEGALYPALHRLERRGLLSEEWGVSDTGREAKFYTMTAEGRLHLQAEIERWTTHSRAVSLALGVA
jgi:PadR family transcriptional regulator, regulatory protein PadR